MAAAWVAFIAAWMALFQEPPQCAPRHVEYVDGWPPCNSVRA